MDPNATLRRILDAANANDRRAYRDACQDLAAWLRHGGFKPAIPEDMRVIPGTGTLWAILSPDSARSWTLIRYTPSGAEYRAYALA